MKRLGSYKYDLGIWLVLFSIWYYFCLPTSLFDDDTCTVITDKNGVLLGAHITDDEQWRFPYNPDVPEKFEKAIIAFEDKRFYTHPGVDPLAIGRAIHSNVSSGEVVSGASTITMQVIRLSRKGQHRTFSEKLLEVFLATRLEIRHSKMEILALYASNAPFGGNVVGLDAAAWKYFGREPDNLSWSESAMLAVLPNSPALIHPGKNREALKTKRDRLLDILYAENTIDSVTCYLSKLEPLPDKPQPLPGYAPHLLTKVLLANKEHKQQGALRTTLDVHIQQQCNEIINRHHIRLKKNGVYNAAALIINTKTGNVLAYTGNTDPASSGHGSEVDIITAPRSTGSILKPILYAAMLNDGELLPQTLVPDVPVYFGGYSPENYDLKYSGAVPADKVISRSLNIPSVNMLNQYGVARFHKKLQQLGMTSFSRVSSHYGLSLILGGGETTVWDLGKVYTSMAQTLLYKKPVSPIDYTSKKPVANTTHFQPAAVWHTFEAMMEVMRPGANAAWKVFNSSHKIAWKTGTSFGSRDAWAVGCTPDYVVVVWAGNADGEGREGLTGIGAAGPILFDLFDMLQPQSPWFQQPKNAMVQIATCKHSGFRASQHCQHTTTTLVPKKGLHTRACPHCQTVFLDPVTKRQTTGECTSPMDMVKTSYFVLPPLQAWYYRQKHPDYRPLPDFTAGCSTTGEQQYMQLSYPEENASVFIPVGLQQQRSKLVLEVAHHQPENTIYWHLDGQYMGNTTQQHKLALLPQPGKHTLTLMDKKGEMIKRRFEVVYD